MNASIQAKIKNFLCHNFTYASEQLSLDLDLLENLIQDSIHVLAIAQFLETEFNLTLNADDMEMRNFSTLKHLTDFVVLKMSV